MYSMYVKPTFQDKVNKIRTRKERENVWNQIEEVANTLETDSTYYENIRKPYQQYCRVNVNEVYVIMFLVDEENRTVTFYNYLNQEELT